MNCQYCGKPKRPKGATTLPGGWCNCTGRRRKITKEHLNNVLWKEYQEEMKDKNSSYTIGTFGIWAYHKGLTDGKEMQR